MKSWDLNALDLKPRLPEILSTNDDARAIALDLEAGQDLAEHQVYERAWMLVISGEIEASTVSGESTAGGPGTLLEFNPGERRQVNAVTEARILLMLTPWPGKGHPGGLSLRQKLYARRRAAKQRAADSEK